MAFTKFGKGQSLGAVKVQSDTDKTDKSVIVADKDTDKLKNTNVVSTDEK